VEVELDGPADGGWRHIRGDVPPGALLTPDFRDATPGQAVVIRGATPPHDGGDA
jgi:hypothetical protein